MGRIFLSYARENLAVAERLAQLLEADGHEVWWDRRIDGGSQFSELIESELARCDLVLVAWSKQSVKSRWVRDEASVAGDDGRLLPVSIDGTQAPMGFRQFHTIELSGWRGQGAHPKAAELLTSVAHRLATKSETPPLRKTTAPAPAGRSLPNPRLMALAAGLLLAIVGAVIFLRPSLLEQQPEQIRLGIVPFAATGADPQLRQLAIQSHDAIAHAFASSGVPLKQLSDGESRSDVDYVIVGNVSATANGLISTVRLDDADQTDTVWSRQIEAATTEASVLPERIAAQIAGTFGWAGAYYSLVPDNPQLTTAFLQTDLDREALENYQSAARVADSNPNSAWAQLARAMFTAFAIAEIPAEQRVEALSKARAAARRAKELMPKFGDIYIPDCLLQPASHYARCEQSLESALKSDPDAPWVNHFYANMLLNVGRTADAADRADLSYTHDSFMPVKIGLKLRTLASKGERQGGGELYEKAMRWWPKTDYAGFRAAGMLERGDFESLSELGSTVSGGPDAERFKKISAVAHAIMARSLPKLRNLCGDEGRSQVGTACMIGFAQLGDLDATYRIVDAYFPQTVGSSDAETEKLWLANVDIGRPAWLLGPSAAALRLDPRFLDWARRIGLVKYWRNHHLPDFCTKAREPVCAQIKKG